MKDNEVLFHTLLKQLKNQEFEQLIASYTDREALLKTLITRDPRWLHVLPLLRDYISAKQQSKSYFENRRLSAWDNLQSNLANSPQPISRYRKISRYVATAAAVLFICTFTIWYSSKYYQRDQFTREQSIAHTWKSSNSSSEMILLPDSTKVWLNKHSRISYLIPSDQHTRQVKITGEAYFEVKSSVENPFQVITQHGVIEVTGTHFFTGTTKAGGRSDFYVELLEGKVMFNAFGFRAYSHSLLPKNRIVRTGEPSRYEWNIEEIGPEEHHLWLRKDIDYHHVPLPKLLRQLEEWYNCKITLDQTQLANLHFSGKISPKQSLEENLDKLTWTAGLSYKKINKEYLIKKH